jgi:hypothetical protein
MEFSLEKRKERRRRLRVVEGVSDHADKGALSCNCRANNDKTIAKIMKVNKRKKASTVLAIMVK